VARDRQWLAIAWEEMLDGFRNHHMLVVAFVEAMAQGERSEDLCEQMAAHYRAHYRSLRVAVPTSSKRASATTSSKPPTRQRHSPQS
jgi:hypothetical protein